ncbi:MAG: sensor histidine kinase [Bryobacteraceae bacterium]|jgi:signal transduction histidine kinase
MNLRLRLTLSFVFVNVLMVAFLSAVDLANELQVQFQSTLDRASSVCTFATDMVKSSLNRQLSTPLEQALQDPDLANMLRENMAKASAILEIAVVNENNQILADSIAENMGKVMPPYASFQSVVTDTGWYGKLAMLNAKARYYQLERALSPPTIYVRVVIHPALISSDILPRLQRNFKFDLLSVAGAALVTMLFSAVVLRPLGRLRRQLELVASGQYELAVTARERRANDEVSMMASNVDILSQRLRGAQYEVSDLRGNLDRLLADLEEAVFIFNRENHLIFASGTVEKFVGRGRAELAGLDVGEVFPDTTALGLIVGQAARTGRPVRNRRVAAAPLGDASSGMPAVLLSVDLLETAPRGSGLVVRLRDAEAQRQLGRELQTADRLAALSRVSGGVAHEVKNPLNAMLLHVEVARAKLARGDTAIEPQIEIISSEIARLDRVVKTFLDFTRPVELRMTTVPVSELLEETVALARPQAEAAGIRVSLEDDSGGASVRVDRDLFKQAVLNVVVNAIEAMPQGGELRLACNSSAATAEIRISDSGPGIPPALREKIFRLYFTTKEKGSGIGLAMTFRMVQLHDGTIEFSSEPGKGTTFTLRIPVAA